MTDRKRLSTRDRVKVFEAGGGICHICGGKIAAGERWEVEHPIPLACGGADDATNWAPAHVKCHREKTNEDAGKIAKGKRVKAKHLGAYRSSSPMPGGRGSPWKRTFGGRVVRREV